MIKFFKYQIFYVNILFLKKKLTQLSVFFFVAAANLNYILINFIIKK